MYVLIRIDPTDMAKLYVVSPLQTRNISLPNGQDQVHEAWILYQHTDPTRSHLFVGYPIHEYEHITPTTTPTPHEYTLNDLFEIMRPRPLAVE